MVSSEVVTMAEEEVKGKYVSFRLTDEIRERVRAVAKREHRQTSDQIRLFIDEGLERHERQSEES